jgi:penicillin-insensitive murein DD-endopeptidase
MANIDRLRFPDEQGMGAALRCAAIVFLIFAALPGTPAQASTCYGTVGNGRLDRAVQLPAQGPNFLAYSRVGVQLGRTYVHSTVRDIVLDAYSKLERAAPGKTFVYGETGLAHGGPMRPHRTHQAGLSVDFMVPVIDGECRSVPLPSTPLNKFGYGLEFDKSGSIPGLRIDFDAMAEHLHHLALAAQQRGVTLELVIFDQLLLRKLLSTRRGGELRTTIPFMRGRPWIRHDEHYHVDFGISCALYS